MASSGGAAMNHYVIEAVLKEKRQDMLQEAYRLRCIREYEEHVRATAVRSRSPLRHRVVGSLEVGLGNLFIRVGLWLTKRPMRRGYAQVCKG